MSYRTEDDCPDEDKAGVLARNVPARIKRAAAKQWAAIPSDPAALSQWMKGNPINVDD